MSIVVLIAGASPKECAIVADRVARYYTLRDIDAAAVDMSAVGGISRVCSMINKKSVIILHNDKALTNIINGKSRESMRHWGAFTVGLALVLQTPAVEYMLREYGEDDEKHIALLADKYMALPKLVLGARRTRYLDSGGEHGVLIASGKAVQYIDQLLDGVMV